MIDVSAHCLVDEVKANAGAEKSEQSVEEEEEGDNAKEGHPEPEHEVDLLIDDVLAETR